MRSRASIALPAALLAVLLGACAGGSDNTRDSGGDIGEAGTGAATTDASASAGATSDDAPGECVPGQQIACACPGGAPGAQACLADGSGYDACECPSASSDDGGSSSTTTSADSSSSGGSTDSGSAGECEACTADAINGACGMQLQSCLDRDPCAALVMCTQQCGVTPACADGCVMMAMVMDSDLALFLALTECIQEACPACSMM